MSTSYRDSRGKVNFLRSFISNYAEVTNGFMFLLKNGVPFIWDEFVQQSFDAFKKALMSTPLLSPLDYNIDLLLYLMAS
jgi:hypothetical protein